MRHSYIVSLTLFAASAFILADSTGGRFDWPGSPPAAAKGKSGESHGQGKGGKGPESVSSNDNGKPNAAVHQYAVDNDLKQGDVAKLLKSWNSLNRSSQAYLNAMDNPHSLPGLQIAYIRENGEAVTALTAFEAIKLERGWTGDPPTDEAAAAARALLDGAGVTAEDVLTDPGSHDQTLIDAANTVIVHDAWVDYQEAEAEAQAAFAEASVSYHVATYDEATFGTLRDDVDAIIAAKGLYTLVEEFDAAVP